MRYLDEKNIDKIGLRYLLDDLTTISPYGNIKKRELLPIGDILLLEKTYDQLENFIDICKNNSYEVEKIELLLMKLKDISNIVLNLDKGRILDEVELFELKINVMLFNEIRSISNLILPLDFALLNLKHLVYILDPLSKNVPTFHIYSEYSSKLKEIRSKKDIIEKDIFATSNYEEQKKLKEERRELVVLENKEENEVKKQLSNSLKPYVKEIFKNIETIKNIDFTLAKAKLSMKYNAKRPIISKDTIEFIGMFNPEILLDLEGKNQKFQKLDILLKKGNTMLTGANMGGKTVVLKTLTLNLYFAQLGFFVFADFATLPLLDFVHFLSDDVQDVSKGLSSFGGEIVKLKEITGCLKSFNCGFIALDEFARGTNPTEGKIFVKAFSEYINKFESFSIMATHFDGVVGEEGSHYQVVGLKNIDFDRLKRKLDLSNKNSISLIQQHMDYSIEKVKSNIEVPKDAFNIASLIGLDNDLKEIINKLY